MIIKIDYTNGLGQTFAMYVRVLNSRLKTFNFTKNQMGATSFKTKRMADRIISVVKVNPSVSRIMIEKPQRSKNF